MKKYKNLIISGGLFLMGFNGFVYLWTIEDASVINITNAYVLANITLISFVLIVVSFFSFVKYLSEL